MGVDEKQTQGLPGEQKEMLETTGVAGLPVEWESEDRQIWEELCQGKEDNRQLLGGKPSSELLLQSPVSARWPEFHSLVCFGWTFLEALPWAKGMVQKIRILYCNWPEKAMGSAWARCREFQGLVEVSLLPHPSTGCLAAVFGLSGSEPSPSI